MHDAPSASCTLVLPQRKGLHVTSCLLPPQDVLISDNIQITVTDTSLIRAQRPLPLSSDGDASKLHHKTVRYIMWSGWAVRGIC